MWVYFLQLPISSYNPDISEHKNRLRMITQSGSIAILFDLIEFFVRHPNTSEKIKQMIAESFINARAAYRVVDNRIIVIATGEQAEAVQQAIDTAGTLCPAARSHLVGGGHAARQGDWAGSVRESIHAVEAAARLIEPSAKTLGEALNKLERNNHLHGGMKAGLSALYGYTNDERGVRHSLQDDAAKVDETDAIFMLGACAAFVSYLLARSRGSG